MISEEICESLKHLPPADSIEFKKLDTPYCKDMLRLGLVHGVFENPDTADVWCQLTSKGEEVLTAPEKLELHAGYSMDRIRTALGRSLISIIRGTNPYSEERIHAAHVWLNFAKDLGLIDSLIDSTYKTLITTEFPRDYPNLTGIQDFYKCLSEKVACVIIPAVPTLDYALLQ